MAAKGFANSLSNILLGDANARLESKRLQMQLEQSRLDREHQRALEDQARLAAVNQVVGQLVGGGLDLYSKVDAAQQKDKEETIRNLILGGAGDVTTEKGDATYGTQVLQKDKDGNVVLDPVTNQPAMSNVKVEANDRMRQFAEREAAANAKMRTFAEQAEGASEDPSAFIQDTKSPLLPISPLESKAPGGNIKTRNLPLDISNIDITGSIEDQTPAEPMSESERQLLQNQDANAQLNRAYQAKMAAAFGRNPRIVATTPTEPLGEHSKLADLPPEDRSPRDAMPNQDEINAGLKGSDKRSEDYLAPETYRPEDLEPVPVNSNAPVHPAVVETEQAPASEPKAKSYFDDPVLDAMKAKAEKQGSETSIGYQREYAKRPDFNYKYTPMQAAQKVLFDAGVSRDDPRYKSLLSSAAAQVQVQRTAYEERAYKQYDAAIKADIYRLERGQKYETEARKTEFNALTDMIDVERLARIRALKDRTKQDEALSLYAKELGTNFYDNGKPTKFLGETEIKGILSNLSRKNNLEDIGLELQRIKATKGLGGKDKRPLSVEGTKDLVGRRALIANYDDLKNYYTSRSASINLKAVNGLLQDLSNSFSSGVTGQVIGQPAQFVEKAINRYATNKETREFLRRLGALTFDAATDKNQGRMTDADWRVLSQFLATPYGDEGELAESLTNLQSQTFARYKDMVHSFATNYVVPEDHMRAAGMTLSPFPSEKEALNQMSDRLNTALTGDSLSQRQKDALLKSYQEKDFAAVNRYLELSEEEF